jgi:hypothetical protein
MWTYIIGIGRSLRRSCIPVLLVAGMVQPLAIVPASARARDHINYGYCPGSLRLMIDVSRCRPLAPDSGQCPAGQIARGGSTWAYHVRCCHDPDKPSPCWRPPA